MASRRSKVAVPETPCTAAVTVKAPVPPLAITRTEAEPFCPVCTVSVDPPAPAKVTLGPLTGALKVTDAPGTGFPP